MVKRIGTVVGLCLTGTLICLTICHFSFNDRNAPTLMLKSGPEYSSAVSFPL